MESKSSIFKKINPKSLLSKIIPNLENQKTKGDNGVVGVIGGSFEYTGAPYYSAISALKSGCDLSHVFCHVNAAIPIKSYSPELIVHPGFDEDTNNSKLLDKTVRWFKSMDCLVLGPGLGRDDSTYCNVIYFLVESLKLNNLVHVIDADGLWHFMNADLKILKIAEKTPVIFTPNQTEFNRMYDKFISSKEENTNIDSFSSEGLGKVLYVEDVNSQEFTKYFSKEVELATYLNNKVILKKGKHDIITDGKKAFIVCNQGSLKRCGGIGDILDGIIATLCSMINKKTKTNNDSLTNDDILEAVALSCYLCKEAAYRAYSKHGYSLTAPDVIVEVANMAINYKF